MLMFRHKNEMPPRSLGRAATAALHDFSEISFRKKVGRGNEKRGTAASPAQIVPFSRRRAET
jgi:hypothetical protein